MTATHELERRLADFYASEAPQRAPERVLEGVLALTDITRQRRAVISAPWRFQIMNNYAKFAVAAVAVIAIGALGIAVLRPGASPGIGGQPTTGPSLSPPPNVTPSDSPVAPPALTEAFTSERHGLSISYPAGWVTRPATEPWTTSIPSFESPDGDVIYDPVSDAGHLFFVLASQPLGGTSGEQWEDDVLAGLSSCEPPIAVTIDGSQGKLCGSSAVTSAGDRGYLILLYVSGDDPSVGVTYDQAYFEQILATVQLFPEDAVAVAEPPDLTETFSSPTNGIAVSYPTGWQVETATTEWTSGIPLRGDTFRDLIFDPVGENAFLLIASQALGLRTGEQFVTETVADPAWGDGACQPTTESVPVNGISGSLVTHCDGTLTAVALRGDRGYLIVLYGIDDAGWFRDILGSAQLSP